mgnify:CR=1 FL=1
MSVDRKMPKLKNGYVFDEEKLINLVRKYECLYNMKSKDYKDDAMKDNIWADIAKELKVPDDQEPCPGKFYQSFKVKSSCSRILL